MQIIYFHVLYHHYERTHLFQKLPVHGPLPQVRYFKSRKKYYENICFLNHKIIFFYINILL